MQKLFTIQRIITHGGLPLVLITLVPSAERVVLEYVEAVMKNNW